MAAVKANRLGQLYGLNVAAAVLGGAETAIADAVEELGAQEQPLARLGTVHFARMVFLPDLPRRGDLTLWWSVTFDGTLERFCAGVRRHAAAELDGVLRYCCDWPGAHDDGALIDWVRAHQVPVHYFLAAYPQATVADVRRALARRRALAKLVLEAQDMAPRALRDGFDARVRTR